MSCSEDNTVRLWSLNSPNCSGQLNLHAPYLAAYDPSASVIAIASPPTHSILLYDLRNYDKPPFATFVLQQMEQQYNPGDQGRNWTKLEFSNDGKSLLVGTSGKGHFILDAFTGDLRHFCWREGRSERRPPGGYETTPPTQGDMCFTPDGQYLIGGSGDSADMLVWDIAEEPRSGGDKGLKAKYKLPGFGKNEVVGYNPRTNLLCSGDKELLMWHPDPEFAPI